MKAIRSAFWGEEAWDDLGNLVKANGPGHLLQWWFRTDPEARAMVRLKHRFPDYPNSNGAAEWPAAQIRDRIGARKKVFRNANRLATVIGLMGIQLAGEASASAYARILRNQFERSAWQAGDPWVGHDWARVHDEVGRVSSLDELIFDACVREDTKKRVGQAAAQTASMSGKLAAVNVVREARGVEPLSAPLVPGKRPSIKVAGMLLEQFPDVLDQWDHDANAEAEPGKLEAGKSLRAAWICPRGHRYRARVIDRTKFLTGCRICNRGGVGKDTSLAALHPDLVAEWDAEANPKSPDQVKANSTESYASET